MPLLRIARMLALIRTYAVQLASRPVSNESSCMALQVTEFFGLAPL